MITPVQHTIFQQLLPDIAPRWCHNNLPTTGLESKDSFIHVLSYALNMSELLLHLTVKRFLLDLGRLVAVVVDAWLLQEGLTMLQYLSCVSIEGSQIDGLFLWLASHACQEHLNLVHGNGVWTTRTTGMPDLHDVVIVLTLDKFLASPHVCVVQQLSKSAVKWGLPDSWASDFVQTPCVLNSPICDLDLHLAEIGLVPSAAGPQPLHQILATLMGGDYHDDVADWILEYKSSLLPVTQWLASHGLDIPDYVQHLHGDSPCDGLELWLVPHYQKTPINVTSARR